MKLRNITQQYKSKDSQVVDSHAPWGAQNRASRRRGLGGKRNQPLFRGAPILTQIWVEREGLR
jgi:hypothetical protein